MDYRSKLEQLLPLYSVNKYKGLLVNIENENFLKKDGKKEGYSAKIAVFHELSP